MNIINYYDVVIIGGGHAGCEAANASATIGNKTILVTLNIKMIGSLPCNPSIGGPAKSHLVSEIDALGGLMGKIADRTAIQKKILNKKKGPAVQALRMQVDRSRYSSQILNYLKKINNLDIIQEEVVEIINNKNKIKCIKLNSNKYIYGKKIIITTGTYLRSKISIGNYQKNIGPNEINNSNYLSSSLENLGFSIRRFKTGTSPRIDKRTIDYTKLKKQNRDKASNKFCFFDLSHYKNQKQALCYLANTTIKTKRIIEENINKSPLRTGIIKGIGPRYCPSIEDKIMRFPNKLEHNLFVEPEGEGSETIYLQGFSTSLPKDIQEKLIHTIKGFEKAKILKYGYAIEYDVINSQELKLTLESKNHKGIYFAGQINGTSGYEEAAAQGIIAGINASLSLKNKKEMILKRSESYIGVLIDDLITKGTNEPYRMFTSRAEYRLLLRSSNSDFRLIKKAYKIGMVSELIYDLFKNKYKRIKDAILFLKKEKISCNNLNLIKLLKNRKSSQIKQSIKAIDLLKRPEIRYEDITKILCKLKKLSIKEKEEVSHKIKYYGYIKKQINQVKNFNKNEKKILPPDIDYSIIKSLTKEAIEKLSIVKPYSIGQANRISGVNPSDIQILLIFLEQKRRQNL